MSTLKEQMESLTRGIESSTRGGPNFAGNYTEKKAK
jgi:hypothetical protein